jgi:pyrimidine-specific ribonucleoside hydrolase
MHGRFETLKDKSLTLGLIWKGMDAYLIKKPAGKKFHDPLAACCAIDESIGTWAEVDLYRERGAWGARLSPGSRTWIITSYDHDKFVRTLIAC